MPFGFGKRIDKYDEKTLQILWDIWNQKKSLPEEYRGIANSLGLYVQRGSEFSFIAAGSQLETKTEFDIDFTARLLGRDGKSKVSKYQKGDWESLIIPTFQLLEWVVIPGQEVVVERLESDEFRSKLRDAIEHFETNRNFAPGYFESISMVKWLGDHHLGKNEYEIIDKLNMIGHHNKMFQQETPSVNSEPSDYLYLKVRRREDGTMMIRTGSSALRVDFSFTNFSEATEINPNGYQVTSYDKGEWEDWVDPTYQLVLWLKLNKIQLGVDEDMKRLEAVVALFKEGHTADSEMVGKV